MQRHIILRCFTYFTLLYFTLFYSILLYVTFAPGSLRTSPQAPAAYCLSPPDCQHPEARCLAVERSADPTARRPAPPRQAIQRPHDTHGSISPRCRTLWGLVQRTRRVPRVPTAYCPLPRITSYSGVLPCHGAFHTHGSSLPRCRTLWGLVQPTGRIPGVSTACCPPPRVTSPSDQRPAAYCFAAGR